MPAAFSMFLSAPVVGGRFQADAYCHDGHRPPDRRADDQPDRAPDPGRSAGPDRGRSAEHAEAAKKGCPVSKALTGPEIRMHAVLVNERRPGPASAHSRILKYL